MSVKRSIIRGTMSSYWKALLYIPTYLYTYARTIHSSQWFVDLRQFVEYSRLFNSVEWVAIVFFLEEKNVESSFTVARNCTENRYGGREAEFSPVQKDGWIQGCSHARRPYPASGKKFARVALSLHYHRWCITVESRSPSGITTCMETRGIIEASSHLATVWLIDVVANKFGVIGWRVYRHVAADFSPLGSPSSVRAQFLWKLIGSKISRTVSRDRWTGYVSNGAPIFTVCLYALVSFPLKNRPIFPPSRSSYFSLFFS